MERYIIIERWMAFFYTYCFLGWCFESTYVSLKERRLTNRGFLKGPILPIYGFGAITILISTILVTWSIPLIFICGMIGATVLEYFTGMIMESMFSMKYWDYSNQRFHVKGYICLSSSIAWGFFSVLLVKVIHVPVARFVDGMDKTLLAVLVLLATAVGTADFIYSFRKAISLKKLLDYQTAVKKEIRDLTERLGEVKETLDERANERQREYIAKQEERINGLVLELDAAKFRAERFSKSIIRSFPHSSSERFDEALEEIKSRVLRK